VYVATAAGGIAAFARRDGAGLWTFDGFRNRDLSGPSAFQDLVVVGDLDGYVHFLAAADGALQGRARVRGGRVTGSPLVVNDLLYVQTEGGRLAAFRVRPRARR
jgi:outer membrane protein assembly factor BamB